MEHKQWQDLIPFYIAQTLEQPQKQAFEHHMATCASCQQEIAEWRGIASAVWADADSVARSLPPLSQEVYNRLQYRNKPPANRYDANPPRPAYAQQAPAPQSLPRRRNTRGNRNNYFVPLTMVAGFVVTVLFGGLLIMLALNLPARTTNDGQGAEIALQLTQDVAQRNAVEITPNDEVLEADFAAPVTSPEPSDDPFQMTILPTLTPTQRPAQLPATQNIEAAQLPQTDTSTQSQAASQTQAEAFVPQPIPTNTAEIAQDEQFETAAQSAPQQVQPQVEAGSGGAGGMGGGIGTGGAVGDNPESDVMAMSAMALPESDMPAGPFITLTPYVTESGAHECFLFNPTLEGLTVYVAASIEADVAGLVMPDEEYRTLIRSRNGWYEIALEVREGRYLSAWMPPQTAYLRGNCSADVFWSPTATQSSSQAPVVQPSPSPTLIRVTEGMVATINKSLADLYRSANFNTPVAVAAMGDAFEIVGSSGVSYDQFVQVRFEDGRLLWIWAEDVDISNR